MRRRPGRKVYPRDIKAGQYIRLPLGQDRYGRRVFDWRVVISVAPRGHWVEIAYLRADGLYDVYNRLEVAANSKHEVRG